MNAVPRAGHIDAATIEREVKYRLSAARADELRVRLVRVARFVREEVQDTIVFDDRVGALPAGAYLRVRITGGRTELTLKSAKVGSGLDAWRTEHSVMLGPGPILDILDVIGFTTRTRYTKRTRIYAFGPTLVYLDQVDRLGWFCELETDDRSADLRRVATALDLRDEEIEPRGYPALAAEAARP